MADDQAQVANEGAAQAAATDQQESASAGAQQDQASEERFDAEYVKKLRAEAAEYRKRLRELEQTVGFMRFINSSEGVQ